MIIPPALKKGDKVAIVSTARKISKEELSFAVKTIESWGLIVVLGKNVFEIKNQFAGSEEQKVEDFQWALNDPEIKAIICSRGGYGTVRMIDSIDFSTFKKNPKWIAGYSDITVLHNHVHANCNVATIHSTMPISFETNTEKALTSLKNALFGETIKYDIPPHKLNRFGEASGEIIGGNLSIIYSLIGSESDINTKGKILFLEDLDEYLYHVDRMMQNLKRSGKLSELAGLVVGGMTEMNDNAVTFGKTAEEIILEAVSEYNFPVCFNFPAGHIDDNNAVVFGKEYKVCIYESINRVEIV